MRKFVGLSPVTICMFTVAVVYAVLLCLRS